MAAWKSARKLSNILEAGSFVGLVSMVDEVTIDEVMIAELTFAEGTIDQKRG